MLRTLFPSGKGRCTGKFPAAWFSRRLCIFIRRTTNLKFPPNWGSFGAESDAESAVAQYCTENTALVHARGIIAEKIVNRCPVGRRNWAEGFTVSG